MLVGSTAIVLFGAALIRWSAFGLFVDRDLFSYPRAARLLPFNLRAVRASERRLLTPTGPSKLGPLLI